ncbi:MAG: hypothetical protein N5P05_002544 [Chroococcopsis gigantea SAG 12.99]|jgi:16S rRNA C1402 (ribose-2'-O) methylase RsmI|nr:hypothetical protein [Chroococcopsis gigantea SAG 12.99]
MVYIRVWQWLSYYDDTRVLVEREITKRHEVSADRDIKLAQIKAESDRYLGELNLHMAQIAAQKEVLVNILQLYGAERQAFFAQRDLIIRSLLAHKEMSLQIYHNIALQAAGQNNLEMLKIASEFVVELQNSNPLVALKEIEDMSSQEVLKVLGASCTRFLPG